jgi:hypothetical protein
LRQAPMALSFSSSVHITKPTVSKWTTRGLIETQLLERDRCGPVVLPRAAVEEELRVAVVASLASARRRDGLLRCDVQLNP